MRKILFVAANPAESDRLALDHEHRAIEEALVQGSSTVGLEAAWAVDLERLVAKLLGTRASVVHFAGHGRNGGILLESGSEGVEGIVSPEVLAGVLRELGEEVVLVVLNACYTEELARSLTAVVPCAVGMRTAVADAAALLFASTFYRVLGSGRSIGAAFRVGVHAVETLVPGGELPQLVVAEGVDPDAMFLGDSGARRERTALNMAMLPPRGWVPRPEEFARLLELVVGRDARRGGIVALVGGGGGGKTTLARALAHDPRVPSAFSGGILWATLGPEGRALECLAAIHGALTGERPRFVSDDDARHAVATAVGEVPLLLVIDDVWTAGQLAPLLDWGRRVSRLVITRDRRVLPPGTAELGLGRLGEAEALAVVGHALGVELEGSERGALRRLARRLGGWPLLLSLAGPLLAASVRHGLSLTEAAAELAADYDAEGPEALSREVGRMIEAGVAALSPESRRRLRELAVLPVGRPVPLALLESLWGMRRAAAWKFCVELGERSLVERLGRDNGVSLHEVVQAHLRSTLGDEVKAVANRVLSVWGVSSGAGPPLDEAGIDALDDFALENVVGILALAGAHDALGRLLADVRFVQRKAAQLGVGALLRDFEVAAAAGLDRDVGRRLREIGVVLRKIAHWAYRFPEQLPATLFNTLRTRGWSERELADGLLWPGGVLPWPRLLHPLQVVDASEQTLLGHRRGVWACAVSPDDEVLATGDRDGEIRLWESSTGRLLEVLQLHTRDVRWLAFGATGLLFSASSGLLSVWEPGEHREVWRHQAENASLVGAQLLADGHVIVWDGAGTVRWLSAEDGGVRRSLEIGGAPVIAASVRGDGGELLAVVDYGKIVVLDLVAGTNVPLGDSPGAFACAYGPRGMRLVGEVGGRIRVFDRAGNETGSLEGHVGSITCLALADDGRRLVSGATDKTLRLWDLGSMREFAVLRGHGDWVRDCAFAGAERVVSVSSDRSARSWDLSVRSAALAEPVHGGRAVVACALSPDGTSAFSVGAEGRLVEWEVATGRVCRVVGGEGRGVGVAVGDERVVWAGEDGALIGFERQSGAEFLRHELDVRITGLSGARNGKTVALATETLVEIWDLREGVVDTLPLDEPRHGVVSISPDGAQVAVDRGGAVEVLEAATGKSVLCAKVLRANVLCSAFSADARLLVAGYDDYTLRVWGLDDGGLVAELRGHLGFVHACSFAEDSRFVISASNDHTLRVWDVASGACIDVVCGGSAFSCVASSGSVVVAGDRGGNLWMIANARLASGHGSGGGWRSGLALQG